MIIIFVIVNIAHHILTVNLYFHNLQIFHNYILSCRRIISYVFSHSTGSCKCSRTIRTLLSIYSPMISHINICTSISIAYHIKNEVLCIHRTSSDTQIIHRHATVTIHVSYYPSILFTTSSRCIPFEPLISTISSGCITESRYKATSPLSLKL